MTLRLRPGLYQVWRRPGRVQIGLDPRHGVVLDGLTAADEAALAALSEGSTRRRVIRAALAAGGTEDGALALLDDLTVAGVVTDDVPVRSLLARLPDDVRRRWAGDAPGIGLAHPDRDAWQVLERRRDGCVAVVGLGRTGLGLALALAAAGVGRMVLEDPRVVQPGDALPGGYLPEHVGQSRVDAAREVVTRSCPSTTVVTAAPEGRHRLDLVVVVAHGVLAPARVDSLLQADLPHLPVVWGEASVSVGPLVLPGRSSCLRCQHLHRADRDPEWPTVAAQVADVVPSDVPGEETSLVALAVGLATGQVLASLEDAALVTVNAAFEASLPGRGVALRAWPPHPGCGCIRLPAVAAAAHPGTMDR